ncbi:MAG: sel1 repeat family protein [Opitutales bacterium]|nr:sel1 repeat family protein [Opitutales bacterium]
MLVHEKDFKEYLKNAEQGDSIAQFHLAMLYKHGFSVKKEGDAAIDLLRPDFPPNPAEALRLLRDAADQGYDRAQYELGSTYLKGDMGYFNRPEGIKWLRKAAEQGDPDAINALKKLGNFVAPAERSFYDAEELFSAGNFEQAAEVYRKCAEQGFIAAQYHLGYCYANGIGVKKDLAEALKWWRKSAEQGFPFSQLALGSIYFKGKGVEKDYAEALKWYRLAAEQGDDIAKHQIGFCYANGLGVEKDYDKALKCFREAASENLDVSQYMLGEFYANGFAVKKDPAEAAKWYRKAAEHGRIAKAQCAIGRCYNSGVGVDKNKIEAYAWFFLASNKGDKEASDAVYNLSKDMTPEQVQEARKLSEKLMHHSCFFCDERGAPSLLGGSA